MPHSQDLGWSRLVSVVAGGGQSLAHLGSEAALAVTLGRVASLVAHAVAARQGAGAALRASSTAGSIELASGVRSLTIAADRGGLVVARDGASSRFARAEDGAGFVRDDGVRAEAFVAEAIASLTSPPQLTAGSSKGET